MKCILQATTLCTKEIECEYFEMTKQKGLSNKLKKKWFRDEKQLFPTQRKTLIPVRSRQSHKAVPLCCHLLPSYPCMRKL